MEWSAGELALRYASCSVDQAYRAYNRYSQRVGDRYPVQKQLFSRMVVRVSESLKRPLRIKTMKVEGDDAIERATRMLLVTEPVILPGITEGSWASAAVLAFERSCASTCTTPTPLKGRKWKEVAGDRLRALQVSQQRNHSTGAGSCGVALLRATPNVCVRACA
jgi:hypothetical protein